MDQDVSNVWGPNTLFTDNSQEEIPPDEEFDESIHEERSDEANTEGNNKDTLRFD